ncbi:MAG: hypothetical protein P4L64_08735 [Caulobacteraceae bacterium]|nr:hypothetical protein [Caulobacteraceae bacterium]
MRNKSSLLGGAALGVLLAISVSAGADAKTHKKHVAAAPAADANAERVNELAAEVEALKARLDQETLAREQTAAQVQQAQAQAAQAQADAQSARAQLAEQIQTIPGAVKTAVAANAPKPGWWNGTTVTGRVFYDLTDINQKSSGTGGPTPTVNGFNFDIKRAYIGVDHKFNDTYSANITTDFTYDKTTGASQLYLKKTYLQAKYADALTIRLGAADLPWVPFVEDIYGYRYVENVLIDRTKFGTSAEWGVHALGTLPFKPVTISYALSVVNGNGYKVPGQGTSNRSKDMDFEGRLSAKYSDFTVAIGGYEGKLGKNVNGTATYHTAERFDALAAYTSKKARVGVEYLYAKNYADVVNSGKTNTSEGWSGFASYKITDQVGLFGRYDYVQPKKDTASATKDGYFNVGVSYSPIAPIDFALVYKRDKVDNGLFTTSNGAGGVIGGSKNGTYDEIGLWGQYRW